MLKKERAALAELTPLSVSKDNNTFYLKLSGSQKYTTVRIVPQRALGVAGLVYTYGVLIDGYPTHIFYSRQQVEAFLRGLNNG